MVNSYQALVISEISYQLLSGVYG